MKCSNCGANIEGNPKFCIKCGTQIDYAEIEKAEKAEKAKQVEQAKKAKQVEQAKKEEQKERIEEARTEKIPVVEETKEEKKDVKLDKKGQIKKKRKTKPIIITIIILLLIIGSLVVFRKPLMVKGFTLLSEKNLEKDLDAAMLWADRAYLINEDKSVYLGIYSEQLKNISEIGPEMSLYYLDQIKEIDPTKDYSEDYENVYIIIAEIKLDEDPDQSIEYLTKALEINKSQKTIELLAQASIIKAESLSGNNISEKIDILESVLDYGDVEEIKDRIMVLYLESAKEMFDLDPEQSIVLAEKAKEYGSTIEANNLISLAETRIEEEKIKKEEEELSKKKPVTWNSVESSSILTDEDGTYYDYYVFDGNLDTTWAEGVSGHGIGEWIEIKTDIDRPNKINRIEIYNGYKKSEDLYNGNSRVKRALIELSNGYSFYHDFEDEFSGIEVINLPYEMETYYIRLMILDIYPGNINENTGIAQIVAK